ncbi:hypothetical protein ABK046_51370, partial [Streptomyces caeruleatus]
RSSRWVTAIDDPPSRRSWSYRAGRFERAPRQRLVRWIGLALTLVLIGGVAGAIGRQGDAAARRQVADTPALGGADWWPRV